MGLHSLGGTTALQHLHHAVICSLLILHPNDYNCWVCLWSHLSYVSLGFSLWGQREETAAYGDKQTSEWEESGPETKQVASFHRCCHVSCTHWQQFFSTGWCRCSLCVCNRVDYFHSNICLLFSLQSPHIINNLLVGMFNQWVCGLVFSSEVLFEEDILLSRGTGTWKWWFPGCSCGLLLLIISPDLTRPFSTMISSIFMGIRAW